MKPAAPLLFTSGVSIQTQRKPTAFITATTASTTSCLMASKSRLKKGPKAASTALPRNSSTQSSQFQGAGEQPRTIITPP
jgi:hypothetical protein